MSESSEKKSFVLRKEDISTILTKEAISGKHMLEPLASTAIAHGMPMNIIELTSHTNKVEVHKYLSDLWFCLDGEVTFMCGGVMQDAYTRVRSDGSLDETEVRAQGLEGAKEITIKQGDWLWIPAGEPHQHITQGTARLMIIKIPIIDS